MEKQTSPIQIVEVAARWYAAAMISLYAIGKLTGGQFYRKGHLPESIAQSTVEQLSAFDLAWTFFGYSQEYILFIGMFQLMGALMLLWSKSRLLGVAILLPIMANIIVVDAAFGIGNAIVSAIFYFILLVLIAVLNYKQILSAMQALTKPTALPFVKNNWRYVLLLVALVVFTFLLETALLKLAGTVRF
jgi:hypothetical protein